MDAPASPFLDAAASDLGMSTPHLAVALAGVLKADPVWGVHKLTLELAGFFATKDALPTPLLDALGLQVGKPAKAVAEALAHYIAGPLHALALEVAAHRQPRPLGASDVGVWQRRTGAAGQACVSHTSRASAWRPARDINGPAPRRRRGLLAPAPGP